MEFTIKLKAHKKEASTKNAAKPKNSASFGVTWSNVSSNAIQTDTHVVAYNLEKHRKKSQRFGVNGRKLKKPKIIPAKWVCHYYYIPIELLVLSGTMVEQGNRTFKIVSKRV